MSDIKSAKRQLEQLLQAGRLQEARALGERLSAAHPRDADVWYLKGMAEAQSNELDAAVESLGRVLALAPNDAVTHYNLARIQRLRGRTDEAIASYRETLRIQPNLAEAHNNLADLLREQGETAQAERHYKEALRLKPGLAEAWYGMGLMLEAGPDPAAARQAYERALQLRPLFAEAHNNLGIVLKRQGDLAGAEAACQRAIECKPDFADGWNNIGAVQEALENNEAAAGSYRRATELRPERAEFHANLGGALRRLGRFEESVAAYRAALRVDPQSVAYYLGLAEAQRRKGELDGASEALQQALLLDPGDANIHFAMGAVAKDKGELTQAQAHYERGLAFQPDKAEAHLNLGALLRQRGAVAAALEHYRRALELRPDYSVAHSNLLFAESYHVLSSPERLLEAHREWDRRQGAAGRAARFHHSPDGDTGRRLKIGYVSPDLRCHSVSYFFLPILEEHDRSQVEVYCYAEVARPDEVTARLKASADYWRTTVGHSDADVARQVFDDGIDILVDLAGHTANNRLGIFTYKPAPVQVTYLGYFATTGLESMDYWLSDAVLTPPDTVECSTETLWRLPRCCLTYAAPYQAPAVSARPADAPVVFGSLNHVSKISDEAVALWSAVLQAVPDARLLIKTFALGDDGIRQEVLARFTSHGIGAERLDLRGRMLGIAEHFSTYGEIDVALDTVPRTGGTTTADALWMGVPVVSLAGARYVQRLSATMLAAVGLDDLVTEDRDAFIAKAAALARDVERRAALRAELRERMKSSQLCDGRGLAAALEDAYREMWLKYVKREASDVKGEAKDVRRETSSVKRDTSEQSAGRSEQAEAYYRRGVTCAAEGRWHEAGEALREAVQLRPEDADVWHRLGGVQEVQGFHDAAIESYRRAISLQPQCAQFHVALGSVLSTAGRLDAADAAYAEALHLDARNVDAWIGRGNLQFQRGDRAAARDAFRQALAREPNNAEIHLGLGIVAREAREYQEALEHYDRALALDPDNARAHHSRGLALQDLGRVDEARAAYRAALARKPDYVEAYRALVWHQRYSERNAEVEALERLWDRSDIVGARRIQLAFALGKVSEDLGEYDAAFDYFAEGNRLMRATFQYDIAQEETYVDRLIEVFDEAFFAARTDWGSHNETPIMICGMPRSGSTLIEQILASHPQVAAAGEVVDLPEVMWGSTPAFTQRDFPEAARALERALFAQFGEDYVARLRSHVDARASRVTDKLPSNFLLLGMLRVMLPRARVVHCRRNALDTCWSIFKQLFSGRQRFAYDLKELGRYYRLYERLMAHWAEVLPGYLLELSYEDLVADQERETRRLLEFCGLEWDERCLEFYRTERAVRTSSVEQVRRPMYASSIGVGEKYSKHLGSLVAALEGRE